MNSLFSPASAACLKGFTEVFLTLLDEFNFQPLIFCPRSPVIQTGMKR
jgi:hypothetical protein